MEEMYMVCGSNGDWGGPMVGNFWFRQRSIVMTLGLLTLLSYLWNHLISGHYQHMN